jgi:hypothetical protein
MADEDQEMADVVDEGEEMEFDGNEYNIRLVRNFGILPSLEILLIAGISSLDRR